MQTGGKPKHTEEKALCARFHSDSGIFDTSAYAQIGVDVGRATVLPFEGQAAPVRVLLSSRMLR
ncbi:hypothetical protein PC129_g14455 [Phytophthora cactorum]|uniref:Uncharacterized protein n=1 Tax=Phytophthora cactorum TaxID=29920 RepID=A0A329SFB3_9STRA|nr:hypothetical protein Pcac1_g880 [Phytophthora cactorum]KAG2798987.1 hypothetical protein PC111_g20617 [Phytophthora cactorum]KAG2821860.1 hypothetical protein PC112_g11193 [Phytophthora cactorum]KAG2851115.1 hypothetical protein PC113_g16189 [Phytophthora cactorum]KAG2889864.1 hypothetical protein PC114_g17749 [Phytophthora cactorum]